jgi:hypothetical protein
MSQKRDGRLSDAQRRLLASLAKGGTALFDRGLKESLRAARAASSTWHAVLEADVFPAWESLLDVSAELSAKLGQAAEGERDLAGVSREATERLYAGARYADLVRSLGGALYGTATFPGEQLLDEDHYFRLSYLPPVGAAPRAPFALFHAGGTIPYGDRIFRLLPEYNFFAPFLARGIPIYAMELRGERAELDYGDLTLERYIDSLARHSTRAQAHHGGGKLALEGYCGNGSQALAYLAARPDHAEATFGLFASFVTPVDGRACQALAAAIKDMPPGAAELSAARWEEGDGYVPADYLRMGIDLNLRASFYKSTLGYFMAGWRRPELNAVRGIDDLTPFQRRDLAGAYWISADCARRFPVPIGIARYTARLFGEGVTARGELPASYRGASLSLERLRDETTLALIGFYGGQDPVVPDATGRCLEALFGRRYTHVVHPQAGHITYVMSPRAWDPSHARGLRPNPIDLMLEAWPSAASARQPVRTAARKSVKSKPAKKKPAKKKPAKKKPASS